MEMFYLITQIDYFKRYQHLYSLVGMYFI
jgi:hypothetical protein